MLRPVPRAEATLARLKRAQVTRYDLHSVKNVVSLKRDPEGVLEKEESKGRLLRSDF